MHYCHSYTMDVESCSFLLLVVLGITAHVLQDGVSKRSNPIKDKLSYYRKY